VAVDINEQFAGSVTKWPPYLVVVDSGCLMEQPRTQTMPGSQ